MPARRGVATRTTWAVAAAPVSFVAPHVSGLVTRSYIVLYVHARLALGNRLSRRKQLRPGVVDEHVNLLTQPLQVPDDILRPAGYPRLRLTICCFGQVRSRRRARACAASRPRYGRRHRQVGLVARADPPPARSGARSFPPWPARRADNVARRRGLCTRISPGLSSSVISVLPMLTSLALVLGSRAGGRRHGRSGRIPRRQSRSCLDLLHIYQLTLPSITGSSLFHSR